MGVSCITGLIPTPMEKFKQNDQFISKTRISPGHTRQNPVKLIGGISHDGISHDGIKRAYRTPVALQWESMAGFQE